MPFSTLANQVSDLHTELLVFILGIVASTIGYGAINFAVSPIVALRKLSQEIGAELKYYSDILNSPGCSAERANEASSKLRRLGVMLEEAYFNIPTPCRNIMSPSKYVPGDAKISEAVNLLNQLSYSVHESNSNPDNRLATGRIFTLLGIKELRNRFNVSSYDQS